MSKKIIRLTPRLCACGCGTETPSNTKQLYTDKCLSARRTEQDRARGKASRDIAKGLRPAKPASICACGCGAEFVGNGNQLFTSACRERRRKEQKVISNARVRAQRLSGNGRVCSCGEPITRKGKHSCDICLVAKYAASLATTRAERTKSGPAAEYPQIEPVFTPWVRKVPVLPLDVQAEMDAQQMAVNLQCHRSDIVRCGYGKDPGKRLTRAEIDAISGSVTLLHMIPATGGGFVGVGMCGF